jgi:hypothetical protein
VAHGIIARAQGGKLRFSRRDGRRALRPAGLRGEDATFAYRWRIAVHHSAAVSRAANSK